MNPDEAFDADSLRPRLAAWMARNCWSAHALNVAFNRLHMSGPTRERIKSFLAGGDMPSFANRSAVHRFIRDYPAPGTIDMLREHLDEQAREAAYLKDQVFLSRRYAAEEARAERRRKLLAAERAPKVKPPRCPLFGLDKATIAALSGGML